MEKNKEIISIDLDDSESENENDSNRISPEDSNDAAEPATRGSYDRVTRAIKDLMLKDHMKFMGNFDPEMSNRERRKLTRKIYSEPGARKVAASAYDENGLIAGIDKDLCDCLNETCPGCHFPCAKCRSLKCGHECRINRKWMYELIENEGDKTVIKNPFIDILPK